MSYRTLKRLMGETNLERKCRFILGVGLFLLVVNAAMIGLTSVFLGGFVVDGLWAGIGAAIVTGVVSWIAGAFIGGGEEARR